MLTVKQYAAAWNMSVQTVYRLLKAGCLPNAVLVRTTWRIPADEIPLEKGRRRRVAVDDVSVYGSPDQETLKACIRCIDDL